MLVITRRDGESVTIYHEGQAMVLKVDQTRGKIRLCMDAPAEFKVVRTELLIPPPTLQVAQ